MLLNNMNNYIYQYLINRISEAARTGGKIFSSRDRKQRLSSYLHYLYFFNEFG